MTPTGGGKQQLPPTPDYMGAANAMGQYGAQATQYQTYANRPNMNTPFGSVQWTPPSATSPQALSTTPSTSTPAAETTPAKLDAGDAVGGAAGQPPAAGGGSGIPGSNPLLNPGQWTMDMTLSPAQQAALESQQRLGAARSGLGETLFGRAQSELGAAPDWSGLPGAPDAQTARQQAIDATYGQAASRLDPQWSQREEATRTQLLNEGLRPGMQGYDQRMQELGRQRTDAYDTAMRSAIMAGEPVAQGEFSRGLQGRQQGIAELLQRRGSTLNEINALLGGQQVGMPQMPGFSQAGLPATPNYLGAMGQGYDASLNRYNAQQAQWQSLMNGGTNLASLFML